jgi:hypothetical protein
MKKGGSEEPPLGVAGSEIASTLEFFLNHRE